MLGSRTGTIIVWCGRPNAGSRWVHTCGNHRGTDHRGIPRWHGVAARPPSGNSGRVRGSRGRADRRWRDDRNRYATCGRWRSAARVRHGRMAEAGPRSVDARNSRPAVPGVADLEDGVGRAHSGSGAAYRHSPVCVGCRCDRGCERAKHRSIEQSMNDSQWPGWCRDRFTRFDTRRCGHRHRYPAHTRLDGQSAKRLLAHRCCRMAETREVRRSRLWGTHQTRL